MKRASDYCFTFLPPPSLLAICASIVLYYPFSHLFISIILFLSFLPFSIFLYTAFAFILLTRLSTSPSSRPSSRYLSHCYPYLIIFFFYLIIPSLLSLLLHLFLYLFFPIFFSIFSSLILNPLLYLLRNLLFHPPSHLDRAGAVSSEQAVSLNVLIDLGDERVKRVFTVYETDKDVYKLIDALKLFNSQKEVRTSVRANVNYRIIPGLVIMPHHQQ